MVSKVIALHGIDVCICDLCLLLNPPDEPASPDCGTLGCVFLGRARPPYAHRRTLRDLVDVTKVGR